MKQAVQRAEHDADRAAGQALHGQVHTRLAPLRAPAHDAVDRQRPSGGGQPLEPVLRRDMEIRFAHSFAGVRVHADGAAAAAAQSLGALAFTHGQHIAFGAGQFAPHSGAGRQLLAHELAHVVQQTQPGALARTLLKPKPQGPLSVTNQAASEDDKREFARQALGFLRSQGEFFAALPEPRDAARTLPKLRETLNNALQVIAADTSAGAVQLGADLRTTYTEAVRQTLTAMTRPRPGMKAVPPKLLDLYERHRTLIEPFAQPLDKGRDELSAELEAPLPAGATRAERDRQQAMQTARQRMQLLTTIVTLEHTDLFGPNANSGPALPRGTTPRFSSTVPAALRAGLTGVVARLMHGRERDRVLEPNSTIMLALDLRPFGGGNDAYRFTRVDIGSGRQRSVEVWVERQGAILTDKLGGPERTALRKRFDGAGFVRDASFSDDAEFDQVLVALAEIPAGELSELRGLRFLRADAKPRRPNRAAEYLSDTHSITVFDRAYKASASRQGRAGRVIADAAFTIAHEVGHAKDLQSLRTTGAAGDAAQAAQMAEFGNRRGGMSIAGNAPAARRARWDQLDAARQAARNTQLAARSRSGAHWQRNKNVLSVTDGRVRGEPPPAFREAATKDDGRGRPRMPTNYPNPDSFWREYYAECYALYHSDPDLLRRLQPNVFAHLAAEFPK